MKRNLGLVGGFIRGGKKGGGRAKGKTRTELCLRQRELLAANGKETGGHFPGIVRAARLGGRPPASNIPRIAVRPGPTGEVSCPTSFASGVESRPFSFLNFCPALLFFSLVTSWGLLYTRADWDLAPPSHSLSVTYQNLLTYQMRSPPSLPRKG